MSHCEYANRATGSPNGEGVPLWPRYEPRSDVSLELGDEILPRSGVAREICDFFDRVAAELPLRTPGRSR